MPLEISAPSATEILITRQFNAPRELVFDCHTVPSLVRRWLLGPPGWTMPTCDIDLKIGGRYRYVWAGPNGEAMAVSGEHREIIRPERLVSTQIFDEDWAGGETINTLIFTEAGGMTVLNQSVLHSSEKARDMALATGMAEGLEAGYGLLDALLADQPA
jgi:uncharacterized protein YndB with AHSA1/START domain